MATTVTGAFQLRPEQQDAVAQVNDWFARGERVVLLSAPTGSGKTVMAEHLCRGFQPAIYACTTKNLQQQFLRDFTAAEIRGRANYPTGIPGINCDACLGSDCDLCPEGCAYRIALDRALRAPLTVTNTSYLFHKRQLFTGRQLVVIDEADEFDSMIVNQTEVYISARLQREVGIKPLVKSARVTTVRQWMYELAAKLQDHINQLPAHPKFIPKARHLKKLLTRAQQLSDIYDTDTWVREYLDDSNTVVLKPVFVSGFATDLLRLAPRWLFMSATFSDPGIWAAELGLDSFGWVEMPATFPVENRPIFYHPLGNLSGFWNDATATTVASFIAEKTTGNTLVHAVSHNRAQLIAKHLAAIDSRRIHAGQPTEQLLESFTKHGGVLIAAGMERGIDLADDLVRDVVICKVPWPSLGDRRVTIRKNLPGGQRWYAACTARSLMQMSGRGVRHPEDWARTWILDATFANLWGQQLFPAWWADAVTRVR